MSLPDALTSTITAIIALNDILSTSFGPYGQSKYFLNKNVEKLTSRGMRILENLEIENPGVILLREMISSHHDKWKDGTKSIILILAEFFKSFDKLEKLPFDFIRKGLKCGLDLCIEAIVHQMIDMETTIIESFVNSITIPIQGYSPEGNDLKCLIFDLPLQSNVYETKIEKFVTADVIFSGSKFVHPTNAFIFDKLTKKDLEILSKITGSNIYRTTQTIFEYGKISNMQRQGSSVLIASTSQEPLEIKKNTRKVQGNGFIEICMYRGLRQDFNDYPEYDDIFHVLGNAFLAVPRALCKSIALDPGKGIAILKSGKSHLNLETASYEKECIYYDDGLMKINSLKCIVEYINLVLKIDEHVKI